MAVGLFLDVHVPRAIAEQLQRRGVDVLRAVDDDYGSRPDDELLQRATQLGRVVFTQDVRFEALAESWQASGRRFSGLAFGPQNRGSIGEYVQDLELIAKASAPSETLNEVFHLPF